MAQQHISSSLDSHFLLETRCFWCGELNLSISLGAAPPPNKCDILLLLFGDAAVSEGEQIHEHAKLWNS
jgi:hypothetical protein